MAEPLLSVDRRRSMATLNSAGVGQGARRWIMRWQLAQMRAKSLSLVLPSCGLVQRNDVVALDVPGTAITVDLFEVESTCLAGQTSALA